MRPRVGHNLRSISAAHLLADLLEVVVDRVLANAEGFGEVGVGGHAATEQTHHIALAWRQRLKFVPHQQQKAYRSARTARPARRRRTIRTTKQMFCDGPLRFAL